MSKNSNKFLFSAELVGCAGKNSSEMEKALGGSSNYTYKYGRNLVVSFNKMSQYRKGISIGAPIKQKDSNIKFRLKYSNEKKERALLTEYLISHTTK